MSSNRQKENPGDNWTAPEHGKFARHMVKDLNRELIIDHRPEILKPLRMHPLEVSRVLQEMKNDRIRSEYRLRRQGKIL